jgi:hypothetical protein
VLPLPHDPDRRSDAHPLAFYFHDEVPRDTSISIRWPCDWLEPDILASDDSSDGLTIEQVRGWLRLTGALRPQSNTEKRSGPENCNGENFAGFHDVPL